MRPETKAYLFRKKFNFDGNPSSATFSIDQCTNGGVTYYLNGNLLGSVRHTPTAWDFPTTSSVSSIAKEMNVLSGAATGLVNGMNVLNAEVHPAASDTPYTIREFRCETGSTSAAVDRFSQNVDQLGALLSGFILFPSGTSAGIGQTP